MRRLSRAFWSWYCGFARSGSLHERLRRRRWWRDFYKVGHWHCQISFVGEAFDWFPVQGTHCRSCYLDPDDPASRRWEDMFTGTSAEVSKMIEERKKKSQEVVDYCNAELAKQGQKAHVVLLRFLLAEFGPPWLVRICTDVPSRTIEDPHPYRPFHLEARS